MNHHNNLNQTLTMAKAKSKTKKRTENRRTEPYLKAHRSIIDLMLNEDTKEHLIHMAVREHNRAINAEEEAMDYFMKTFVHGVLEPANERLDPDDQSDSLVLHSSDGTYKVVVRQQNRRYFDDRVSEARALIQDFISEHEKKIVDLDPDVKAFISMLKLMFFGSHQKRKFRFTPELHDFMTMDPKELGDARLKKAQKIMKKCYHVEKTRWYREVYKYNDKSKKYEPFR